MDNQKFFTYNEIIKQPKLWQNIFHDSALIYDIELNKINYEDTSVIFIGCGSSYYIAQSASSMFNRTTKGISIALPASEIIFNKKDYIKEDKTYLAIMISRSGTTSEVLLANKELSDSVNVKRYSISCSNESELLRNTIPFCKFPFEQERSIVMTGSFSSMLLVVLLNLIKNYDDNSIADSLNEVEKFLNSNESTIKNIVSDLSIEHLVFLGQGINYGIANEAALKMTEMSLSNAVAFHSLEYRHGPKSIITKKSLVTILVSNLSKDYELKLVDDMKTLGAKTLVICTKNESEKFNSDYKITIPNIDDLYRPFFILPIIQLAGFFRAISKGLNPDLPKNLTAVVEL